MAAKRPPEKVALSLGIHLKENHMDKVSLLGIPGRMLRDIRIESGWSRERLARLMPRYVDDQKDFTSVRSLLRYERMDEVPPLHVQRSIDR